MLQTAKLTGRLAALAMLAAALAGCQSIEGSSQYAQVRYIDASPDSPALDVYENGSLSLYNLGFGSKSSYIPVAPGSYTYSVNASATQQQLAIAHGVFNFGNQYTVLVDDVAANLQMAVLQDQSSPAPSGQAALRFLDQATRAGAVDIYLVPSRGTLAATAPILSHVTFGNSPLYLDVPAGTYSMVVLPSGSSASGAATRITGATLPALYSGNQVNYPGAAARTIILIDQPPVTSGAVAVITADDYDASSSSS